MISDCLNNSEWSVLNNVSGPPLKALRDQWSGAYWFSDDSMRSAIDYGWLLSFGEHNPLYEKLLPADL